MALQIPEPLNLTHAFAGDLPRARRSPTYHLGLLLTAGVMVLLPLIYLAMVLGAAAFVVWYAASGMSLLDGATGRAVGFLYAGPLVIGTLLVVLMLKPLFAPRAEEPVWVEVSRTDEPILWAFVERLCAVVGAPAPRRIRIDCRVNASASFRRGFLSLLGNDLVLTIGLPLVAGLDLRQFTGVLAHEFGHFSQGGGMRATFVIRRINAWFARIAYEDDAWDAALSALGETRLVFLMIIAAAGRLCVFMTKTLLKALLLSAHAVSCYMARRMEFDADRFEVRAVGADAFEQTFERIALLSVASQGALAHAQGMWDHRKLPDSLPGLTVSYLARIPDETKAKILEHLRQPSRRLFDTHPSTRDRVRAAQRSGEPGVFTLDRPATDLFRDFRAACIRATYDEFKSRLGEKIMQATFVDTSEVIASHQEVGRQRDTLHRFFRDLLTVRMPPILGPEPVLPAAEPNKTARRLLELTGLLDRSAEQAKAKYEAATEAMDRLAEVEQAAVMLDAGLRLGLHKFNITPATPDTVARERATAEQVLAAQRGAIDRVRQVNGERLRAALSLALSPGMEKRSPTAPRDRGRIARLVPLLQHCEAAHPAHLELNRAVRAADALVAGLRRDSKDTAITRFREQVADVKRRTTELRASFGAIAYPFERAEHETTVARHLLEVAPPDDPGAVYAAAKGLLERLAELHARTLAELASIADPVERLVAEAARAKRAPENGG